MNGKQLAKSLLGTLHRVTPAYRLKFYTLDIRWCRVADGYVLVSPDQNRYELCGTETIMTFTPQDSTVLLQKLLALGIEVRHL